MTYAARRAPHCAGRRPRASIVEVTPELLGEIRKALPVDFSKRRPFFLGDD